MKRPERPNRREPEWTARALADLRAIEAYIAADDPARADQWVRRLIERAGRAALAPLSGRVVPEKRRPDIREVLLRSYRIVYRLRPRGILVLTVFEGHRRLSSGALVSDD